MGPFHIVCFLALCTSGWTQELTYLITGPRLIRVGAAENVVAQTFGYTTPMNVNISLKSYPDKKITYDFKVLQLHQGNQFQGKATLMIQPKDIQRKDNAHLFVYLGAYSGSFSKEERLPITFDNGFLFIQTDKPIYTPDQSVKVRVYSLDEELKPPRRTTTLTFTDPEGVKVDFAEAEDFIGIVSFPDFKIPANPKFGLWKIDAAYKNDFTTTGHVYFQVKEYELPGYSVSIEPEAFVIGYDKFEAFKITVRARYFYNKKLSKADVYFRFGIIIDGERRMMPKSILATELLDGYTEITFNSKSAVKELGYDLMEDIEGSNLYITVTVLETPDAHPQESELSTVKYVLTPYKLKLIATPLFMRPGLPLHIRVQVTDPLEIPIPMVPLRLTATVFNREMDPTFLIDETSDQGKAVTGSDDGMASFSINIPTDANTLEFKLVTADSRIPEENQAIAEYTAVAYFSLSKSYLYINWAPQYKNLRVGDYVSMNIYLSSHYLHKVTHYSYLILSKGKIVKHGTQSRYTDSAYHSLTLQLTSDMVPSARLLVYYILTGDQTAELVADSVWMNVEDKCVNSQKVQLSTDKRSYEPGKDMELTLKANMGSFISLNAMDIALYEVIQKSNRPLERVLREFEKSDLGCGAGGGKDNTDVFNLAGLTIITNANAKAATGQDEPCTDIVRPKRDVSFDAKRIEAINSFHHKDVRKCCLDGMKHYPTEETCEARASRIKVAKLRLRCIEAFKKCCNLVEAEYTGKTLELARMHIRSLFDVDSPQVRSFFPESWMWKTHKITDRSGSQSLSFTLPDSLTSWEIQGIGISDQGLCVADPVRVEVFKDVFLNAHVPYSVVRGEQIELIGSVYNYRDSRVRACVTMAVGEQICLFKGMSAKVKGIQTTSCSHSYLQASSVTAVKFKILPLELGLHTINFTLNSDYGHEIVVKTLRVVPEGVKKEKLAGFTLDPQGVYGVLKRRHDIRYMVPPNVVPKSKIDRTFSIKGLILGDVISAVLNPEGVKLLTNLPKGSAETELMRVVPIFYVFHYLEALDDWELLGPLSLTSRTNMRRQMKEGILSILSFRNPDFSYSMWKGREPSMWLTAFALRILGQVQQYVPLDQMAMCNTLTWLTDSQRPDGSFVEQSGYFPVKLQGTLPTQEKEKALYLTAFALIGLQKAYKICSIVRVKDAINKAEGFLMSKVLMAESTFTLAISAFALALTDPTKAVTRQAFTALKKEAFIKGTGESPVYRFWKETPKALDPTSPNAGTAQIVETTAYALLATLYIKEMSYANPIMRWLTEEQRFGGGFYSTQDTLNALEALAQYAIVQKKLQLDMVVRVDYKKHGNFQRYELNDKRYFSKLTEVPLNDDLVISTGSGTGVASGSVSTVYHVVSASDEVCAFDLKVGLRKSSDQRSKRQAFEKQQEPVIRYLEACAKYKPNERDGYFESGQAVMQIGLVSGLEAMEEDLHVLANGVDQLISDFSLDDGNVVIHLDLIPSDDYLCVAFRVKQLFKVGMLSPSTFTVYELHAPDKKCTIFYNPYGENELQRLCKGDECRCMEAECSKMQPEINLVISANSRKATACQKDIVYAYKVKIVSSVEDGSFIKYTAVLQDIFKKGEATLKLNNEVKFIKKKSCTDVMLDEGKQYLIMGKEGFQIQVNYSFQYEYALDAVTWVEWWPYENQCSSRNCAQFLAMMEDFSEDILLSGC
ncbi:complement C5 [Pleurodeles waltl]|uniref:complement C5 n=1 Tax=Pleurodeles waltl TaxID=8319 RepID=UPI0037096D2B